MDGDMRFRRGAALICAVIGLLLWGTPASASPIGTGYAIVLDAVVTDSTVFDDEGHAGSLTFDGLAEILPNDLVPGPPFLPGNDLWVTESVTPEGGGERISIDVVGADETSFPPPPGSQGPLFTNPIDPFTPVIFDVEGLFWDGFFGVATISDIHLAASTDGGATFAPIAFSISDLLGVGTASDPFILALDIFDISIMAEAEALHLDFLVTHSVPEPGMIALFAMGLAGIFWRATAPARQIRARI